MEIYIFSCGKFQKRGLNRIVKIILYCPHCETFVFSDDDPPPLIQKKLIEEGADTWIATKPCLECSKDK